jgi:predicted phage terminase large subunit-like protein
MLAQTAKRPEIHPNPGPQKLFLAHSADWVIYGGEAGGGKSWGIQVDLARHVHVRNYTAVLFRRHLSDVTKSGGLWDEALNLYTPSGGVPRQSPQREFLWRDGDGNPLGTIQFGHLQDYDEAMNWKSAQICGLGFDQIEEFGAPEFWYLTSRNRTRCEIPPFLRATCNPDPDCFLVSDGVNWGRGLISWWIGDDGLAIEERSGEIRWFQRINEELHFADTKEEMGEIARDLGVKPLPISLTFIHARLGDNPAMPHRDRYEASLESLPRVDRLRLQHGNWLVRPAAGDIFDRAWFEIVDAAPARATRCRGWDNAASKKIGDDWSSGIRVSRSFDGIYYVEDVIRGQWGTFDRDKVQRQSAEMDGITCEVAIFQDPGSAGKDVVNHTVRNLDGFIIKVLSTSGAKHLSWLPMASQAQAGNVKLVRGPWNETFLREAHNASAEKSTRHRKDDQLDAVCAAFNRLAERGSVYIEGASLRY